MGGRGRKGFTTLSTNDLSILRHSNSVVTADILWDLNSATGLLMRSYAFHFFVRFNVM